jgi:hypothetical protein
VQSLERADQVLLSSSKSSKWSNYMGVGQLQPTAVALVGMDWLQACIATAGVGNSLCVQLMDQSETTKCAHPNGLT